jgi:hypothetical protein
MRSGGQFFFQLREQVGNFFQDFFVAPPTVDDEAYQTLSPAADRANVAYSPEPGQSL